MVNLRVLKLLFVLVAVAGFVLSILSFSMASESVAQLSGPSLLLLGGKDCNNVKKGTAYLDNCEACVGGNTGDTACTQDCNNDWGGTASIDNCNSCVGGNTGDTACTQDCNNDWGGTASIDNCNSCVGGNTGELACTQDCNGDWGGTAYLDSCLTCVGGNTGQTSNLNCVASAGRIWMDRNLGATQVATSHDDETAYGGLYQWGRGSDGHEDRNSSVVYIGVTSDTPGHVNFIVPQAGTCSDWRTPQKDTLWQGVDGINNPCPAGFRLPTETEWQAEKASWDGINPADISALPIKLVAAGVRFSTAPPSVQYEGVNGYYWTSTVSILHDNCESAVSFRTSNKGVSSSEDWYRSPGLSVRCIKD